MTHPTTITTEPGLPFVDIVREFDAPTAAVFRAHTDPELFSRWVGPREMGMTILEFDATTGGRWHYQARSGGGYEFSFRGVFHTVEPDTTLIQTAEFDGAPGLVVLSISHFETIDGHTRLTVREIYPSVEARDMAVESGMESGIVVGYERLDEMLTIADARVSAG